MIAQRLWSWLAAVVTLVVLANSASAQHLTPFIPPDYFDPDLQFFAPAEVDYFDDPAPPTTGWFFTYDRMAWDVSRAENAPQPYELDTAWGNRFDMGFMTEDQGGWLFNLTHLDGPTGGNGALKGALSSVELNRVFRFDPLPHNCIIEPFIGLRYLRYDDEGQFPFQNPVYNNILTGQLGVRAWKNIGLWKTSAELRSFNGVNWQWYREDDFSEFMPGAEIRADLQYNLTRDVSLRVGWEGLFFFDGVGRNNDYFDNCQSVYMQGLTFGFAVNR